MLRCDSRDAVAEVADDLLELHRDQRLVLDDQHRGPRFAVEFADRVRQQCFDRRLVGAGDQPRLFDRKPLERGEQIGRESWRERVCSTCRSRWSPYTTKKKKKIS